MSPRYLLVVDGAGIQSPELLRLSRNTGLEPAFVSGRVAALVNAACHCVEVPDGGCIVGTLFHRHGLAEPLARLALSEAASISRTRGQRLLHAYWGGYVAGIGAAESVRVLRDPSGVFSCYYARSGGSMLFASDADLLAASGAAIELDFEEIGRQLYRANVPNPATALSGVRELLAGFSLDIPGSIDAQECCWSPWAYVSDREVETEAAAERLSRIVRHSIQSWGATQSRLLLSVSGGLDSSIIAACLASAGADVACLTMFSDDAAGDERVFARAVCKHLGLRLIERAYRLDDIDIDEPLAPHLPRPRDRTQANAFERVNLDVAYEIGADAFVTGNGGDNVFGYSQSAASVADRFLAEGIGPGTYHSLLDVCRQTGCSIFDAMWQGWRLARRPPAHKVQPKPLFLKPDFIASLGPSELRHAWLDAPERALPGKAAHISSVLRAQPTLEASRGYFLPVISPLMSQPVIEACLEVPTWEWRAGGRDRSLARRAFERDLPPAVLNRRVKGTPSRFAARLLDHFRRPIRERLLGGRLAAHRVIDAVALEKVLDGDRPVPDLERVRILELVNAEAWIGHWESREHVPERAEESIRSDALCPPPAEVGPTP